MQSYSLQINNHYSILFIHKFKAALRQCKLVNANLFDLCNHQPVHFLLVAMSVLSRLNSKMWGSEIMILQYIKLPFS